MKQTFIWAKRVVFGFVDNHCSLHAAGLTYFSLLAIVPVVCVLLVTAKLVGLDAYAQREVNTYLDAAISEVEHGQDEKLLSALPIGGGEEQEKKRVAAEVFAKQAREVANSVFARVKEFDIRTFGWIGFGLLVWTVISSISMIELSFNEIWGVKRPRPIWKRAYIYLGVALALPIFATLAFSPQLLNLAKSVITMTLGATWLTRWAGDGVVWVIDWWPFRFAVSLLLTSLGFALFFHIMPNTRVRFGCAFRGGLITAVLFCSWLKLCAVAQVGIAKSSALYGSFAFLPIILAWLYMSWQIILIGANMVRAFERVGESEPPRAA